MFRFILLSIIIFYSNSMYAQHANLSELKVTDTTRIILQNGYI